MNCSSSSRERDIKLRYKQAAMGFVWAVFMPCLIVLSGLIIRFAMAQISGTGAPRPSDIANIAVKGVGWAVLRRRARIRAPRASSAIRISSPRSISRARCSRSRRWARRRSTRRSGSSPSSSSCRSSACASRELRVGAAAPRAARALHHRRVALSQLRQSVLP